MFLLLILHQLRPLGCSRFSPAIALRPRWCILHTLLCLPRLFDSKPSACGLAFGPLVGLVALELCIYSSCGNKLYTTATNPAINIIDTLSPI